MIQAIRWDTYFRVIKQTPDHNAVYPYQKGDRNYDRLDEINSNDRCLVIEMGTTPWGTGIEGKRVDVVRRWEVKGWGYGGDDSRWLFSEGQLIGCAFGHQDWWARDHNCGDPNCGKSYGSSAHTRNINEFCSNDDGFNITSLELSYMFATELQRVSTAYLDAVSKATDKDTMKVIVHHDNQVGYNKSDDDNNGGCK